MIIADKIHSKASRVIKFIRATILIIVLSFIISFCILNSYSVNFKLPLLPYVIYMPACLVIFIAPIILKIIRIILFLLIK